MAKPVTASKLRHQGLRNRHLPGILSQNNSGPDTHRPNLLWLQTTGPGRGGPGPAGGAVMVLCWFWDDGKRIQGLVGGVGW